MAQQSKKTKKVSFENLQRYLTGIIIASFVVTVIASAIAGARVETITYRSAGVIIGLTVISRIIVRSWATMVEMKSSAQPTKK